MDNLKTIYARNCTVRRIDGPAAADFLDLHHRMGSASARYRYGLFVLRSTGAGETVLPAGTLVAVACFSGRRSLPVGERKVRSYEWVRYASLSGFRVVGGMGKMLSAFIGEKDPDDVMSYAEPGSVDCGNVYRTLGFESEGMVSKPGFCCEKFRLKLGW